MSRLSAAHRFAQLAFRFRFITATITLVTVFGLFVGGFARIQTFSAQVDSLREVPPENPKPHMFDPRSDMWFDHSDNSLQAYRDIEDQLVAEDVVFLAFEETEHPDGAFSPKALKKAQELTAKLERSPHVRNVRSLTSNPWIRWEELAPGEEGLRVGDLFENDADSYSQAERRERMIAILGAERSAKIIGKDKVRKIIGSDAKFSDYIGEPRLIDGIVSADGRTSAIQIMVLRPQATPEQLDQAFGKADSEDKKIGPAIFTSVSQGEMVKALEVIIAADKDYELHAAGVPVMERHFVVVGMEDMAYVGYMFIAIALALLLIFRRLVGAVLPLVVVFSTIMGMNGSVWLYGDLLNNMTATAPTIVTAVGIADAVHLLTCYFLLRGSYTDKRELITAVVERNALPVFLTSLTTAIGFFSLTVSQMIPIRMLGYTAGIGTLFAYLISMSVIPAVLSLMPLKTKLEDGSTKPQRASRQDELLTPHWSDPLVRIVLSRRKAIVAVTFTLTIFSVIGMGRSVIASDMRQMFADGDSNIKDLKWIEERVGGGGDLELIFKGAPHPDDSTTAQARQNAIGDLQVKRLSEDSSLTAAEATKLKALQKSETEYQRGRIASSAVFLDKIDRLQQRFEEENLKADAPIRLIGHFESGLSVLRKIHQVQNENQAAYYRVPREKDVPPEARAARVLIDDILGEHTFIPGQNASTMLAQYYLQYENGAKPGENLSNLMTPDRRTFRMSARVDGSPAPRIMEAYAQMRQIVHDEFPELMGTPEGVKSGKALSTLVLTGKHYLFTNSFRTFSTTLVTSLSIALLAITLLIGLVFRSPILGAMSIVPNVLPIAFPFAFIAFLGIPVDGPSVVVASVVLGVCVDDTIHFFTKFKHAIEDGMSIEDALRSTFRQVGPALTWTTIVLVIGFGVLGFAQFRPNITVGRFGATMVALAWVTDFLLTPALLSFLKPTGQEQEEQEEQLNSETPAVA
ncbi:MAG: MMPL family transporter [Polyangiaceae bacterium]|nr:MMPL family transporter [Polyangiaceae bacterium]